MPGLSRVDLVDGLGVEPGAAVGEVVARDAGDRRVAQPHRLHALGDPARLVAVEGGRLAGVDLAEVAAAGALVAADEEGRLAVLPALVDVGAAGLLAHRVQALALDQVAQLGELGTHLRAGLDPLGLALDRDGRVALLDAQHATTVGLDGCHAEHLDVGQMSVMWLSTTGSTSATVTSRPEFLRQRRDARVGDAARDERVEEAQVGIAVQGEAVQRHAARDPDADRGDLAVGAVRR